MLKRLRKAWDSFMELLTWISNFVILNLVYFLVVTPLSLLMKLFGKRFFYDDSKGSWETASKPEDMVRVS